MPIVYAIIAFIVCYLPFGLGYVNRDISGSCVAILAEIAIMGGFIIYEIRKTKK